MPSVEAAVCNVALLRIGQLVTVSSLEDASPYGRACKVLYEPARDAVLEAKWWSFAKRRATLAQTADGEVDLGPWSYAYTLPANCIAPRYIETGLVAPGQGDEIPFDMQLNVAGSARVLMTDEAEVELVYTGKIEAMGLWSPMARDALAMKIAGDLAMSVAKKPQLGLELMKAWVGFTNAAAAANARQQREPEPAESETITSRG